MTRRLRWRRRPVTRCLELCTALVCAGVPSACDSELILSVTSTADDGPGSLRDAIDRANADGEHAVAIELPPGTYVLSLCGSDDSNAAGDLDLSRELPVVIRAPNGNAVVRQSCAGDRVLDNHGGALTLTGVTITGGSLVGTAAEPEARGGGIRTASDLALNATFISGNTARNAGPNDTDAARAAQGGGVFVGGSLYMTDSVLEQNEAWGAPGRDASGAAAATAGDAAEGGGGYVVGELMVTGGAIERNRAIGAAGGSSDRLPGAGGTARGGGLFVAGRTLNTAWTNLERVVISANSARGGDAGRLFGDSVLPPEGQPLPAGGDAEGGALATRDAYFTAALVTVRANAATGGSAGSVVGRCPAAGMTSCRSFASAGAARGGAMAIRFGVMLRSSTLSNNRATSGEQFSLCFGSPCRFIGVSPAVAAGGALFVTSSLEIEDSDFSDNSAVQGAARPSVDGFAEGGAIAGLGDLTLSDDTFTRNAAVRGRGGAVMSAQACNATRVRFTSNHADGRGGAVVAQSATLESCVVSANTAGGSGGGAVAVSYLADLRGTRIEDNQVDSLLESVIQAPVAGGGVSAQTIYASATAVLRNRGRARVRAGDAIVGAAFTGGGIATEIAYLDGITVAGNRIDGATRFAPEGVIAAGITAGAGLFAKAEARLQNATLSGNVALGDGQTEPPRGAGIFASDLWLRHATLADNAGAATLQTTRLATRASAVVGAADQRVCAPGATLDDLDFNYFSDDTCGLTAAGSHQGPAAFLLHPLAEYGGPVPTQLPAIDSVLVDRAPCWDAVSCNPPCPALPVDARGVSRPQGWACDVGAAEVQLISR